jgi:small-conductance mechanosensitive channel
MDHLAWVGLLVLSSLFLGVIRPELRYERIVRSLHPYVLVLLVILAVLGWSKLAVLASMLWGVTTLAVQLALGSISVVNVVFERMDKTGLRALAADLGKTVLTLLIVLIAFLGVMAWITVNLGTSAVFDRLSTLELSWGNFSLNFLRLGAVILLFQLVRSLITVWKTVLEDDRLRWKNIDHGAAASLQRIGMYCLWLLFGLISLNLLGISLTSFAVIAGGLSVGIGFGMQTIISNFISGLILLFDRAMQPGDVIEVDGVWGRVVSVNIRNTEVQTYDNAKIFVPNSTLIANNLTNWTHRNDMRMRKDLPVGVAYGSDVAQVKKLLLEAAETHPAVLTKPAPVVFFNDFGPNSLSFMLRFWIRHVDFVVSAPSEIREAIDRSFREHGIEMPFPQMDIHMRSNDDMAMRFNAAEKHPDTAVGPNKT